MILYAILALQEYADHFDQVGKINSVIFVACVFVIGLSIALLYLQRRIKKLEQSQ